MSTTKNDTARICPQCEGAGQEEIRAIPIVCRKCAGTGKVAALQRTAAILYGGDVLEKTAQGELDDPEENLEDGNSEFAGSGFDNLSVIMKDVSDNTIKMQIITMVGQLNAVDKEKLFGRMLVVLGSNPEEVRQTMAGSDGQPSEAKIERFLYASVDGMNRQQLISMHSETRRFV